jgi:hypothetical protein
MIAQSIASRLDAKAWSNQPLMPMLVSATNAENVSAGRDGHRKNVPKSEGYAREI